jgi:hypothetical protein
MHETLRRRILRRLETLPEARLYQVLDYIEFLESRYGDGGSKEVPGLQSLAERLEDELRKRTVSPVQLREAFQIISAADRVLRSVSDVGRGLLEELQGAGEGGRSAEAQGSEIEGSGRKAPERKPARPPAAPPDPPR